MPLPSLAHRNTPYRPALAWFAALGSAWVFVLVTLGALTTTIGAGMVFDDWPFSNGSINPDGWLSQLDMFAEHSHRLSGMIMGIITLGLAIWVTRVDERRWMRKLAWWAVAIVVIQGIIGGKRVLLDSIDVPGFEMTLGQMLRIPHGILAQLYVCILFAIAASLSHRWIDAKTPVEPTGRRLRMLARTATLLVIVQLTIAAAMRHNNAGLAIPTFPFSTAAGDILPAHWDYRITLHFAHRVMAVVLAIMLGWLAWAVWKDRASSSGIKNLATTMICLLIVQIALGASVIWTQRNAHYTTAHVTVGACVLATTFLLTWWLHRDVIEGRTKPKLGQPIHAATPVTRS